MTLHLPDALREAMDTATVTVEPSPRLLSDVVRGGRRRRRRGQATVIGLVVLVGVVAMLAPAAVSTPAGDGTQTPAVAEGPRGIAPVRDAYKWATRGDLAGSAPLRAQALKEWAHPTGSNVASFTPIQNPVGSPRFLWLGHTAAGPAAVLAQDSQIPGDPNAPTSGWGVMVADSGGTLRMTGTSGGLLDDPDVISFVVGPANPQLVVLPARIDATVRYATGHETGADNKVIRTLVDLPLVGGVGITSIPPGQPMDTFVEVQVAGRTVARGPVQSAPIEMYDGDTRRGWLPTCSPCTTGLKRPKSWPADTDSYDEAVALWLGRHGAAGEYAVPGDWALQLWTPGGERVAGFQLQLHGDPATTVVTVQRSPQARLTSADIVYDRVVSETSPLPVQLRLPRGQGWLVVAHRGARIQWRQGDGAWHQHTGLAGLLPNRSDITVAVTLDGSRTEVHLGR